MHRPLSQLVFANIQSGAGSPRLLTLHDHNQRGGDVADHARAACPTARIVGLESYKGVFVAKDITGYTWFVGPNERPSPLFFGDALAEIERFLWDEVDRQGTEAAELPFLLGIGQGAIMALAAAAAAPDLLSGVIAVAGFLPIVPGWSPPLAPLDELPILLLDAPETGEAPAGVLTGEHLVETLTTWGGNVTRRTIAAGTIPAAEMSEWLSRQPVRHRDPADTGA